VSSDEPLPPMKRESFMANSKSFSARAPGLEDSCARRMFRRNRRTRAPARGSDRVHISSACDFSLNCGNSRGRISGSEETLQQ
jgi:hypothetical protein